MTEELKQNSAIFSKTWYEDNTTSYAANHEITSNQTCDVAIIGGGLAGLCLLQNLIKEGVDALLLEANEIGKSASGRNGGFCTPGWALSPEGIESLVGFKLANELNQFSKDGYNWMVNRICSENYRSIDTKKGVLSVSCSGSPVNEYPESLRLIQKDELRTLLKSDRYTFGVFSEEGYQFNPLNFLNCLQKEIVPSIP